MTKTKSRPLEVYEARIKELRHQILNERSEIDFWELVRERPALPLAELSVAPNGDLVASWPDHDVALRLCGDHSAWYSGPGGSRTYELDQARERVHQDTHS